MWREGIGSPLAYPSVVCPLPHTRSHAALSCMCDVVLAGLMLTHSCHDALTLARHATATRAFMMRQTAAMHATCMGRHPLPRTRGLWATWLHVAWSLCLMHGAFARRRTCAAACTCHMPVYPGAHACTAGCPERTISRGRPVYARNSLLLLLLLLKPCRGSIIRATPGRQVDTVPYQLQHFEC